MAIVGVGIGDACRAASVIYDCWRDGAIIRVTCERTEHSRAHEVFENLTFVSSVQTVEVGPYAAQSSRYRLSLEDPAEYIEQRCLPTRALTRLPTNVLRQDWSRSTDPTTYTVVQPSTHVYRHLALPVKGTPWHLIGSDTIVLVGSAADKEAHPYKTGHRRRVIDLRGTLTVAQSMSLIAGARMVVGVDSWAVILGALFGRPTWQAMHPLVFPLLAPVHQVLFPHMINAICPDVECETPT